MGQFVHYFGIGIIACFSVLCAPIFAQGPVSLWQLSDAKTQLQLSLSSLQSADISVSFQGGRIDADGNLIFDAMHWNSPRIGARTDTLALSGALIHRGGPVFQFRQKTLVLNPFIIYPLSDSGAQIAVADSNGNEWLRGAYIHQRLDRVSGRVNLRHLDLSISAWLAEQLEEPQLAGFVVGTLELDARVSISALTRGGSCGPPVWPGENGAEADVALVNMTAPQQRGSISGGQLKIAPTAILRNVGSADIPWHDKFSPPADPYANDQHPYLVWAMYRELDGELNIIGRSQVKHAYFAANQQCTNPDCNFATDPSGGTILWLGCQDVYGASSNDLNSALGPRAEIEAFSGLWTSQGSFFDPDGDGVENPEVYNNGDPFDRRMLVQEADLDIANANYFVEAWYLVRDDIDIYNGIGTLQVDTNLVASTWLFPVSAGTSFSNGPMIDLWVNPNTPTSDAENIKVDTAEGRFHVAVKTRDLGGGFYRYSYALMNLDYDPQINQLQLAIDPDTVISDFDFSDGNEDSGDDWTMQQQQDTLLLQAAAGAGLDWGLMVTFHFTADQAPIKEIATAQALENTSVFDISILSPGSAILFEDGFEEPEGAAEHTHSYKTEIDLLPSGSPNLANAQ